MTPQDNIIRKAQRLRTARTLLDHGSKPRPGESVEECFVAFGTALLALVPEFWELVDKIASGDEKALAELMRP